MLIRIINFLRGYLIIEAKGAFIERFINLAIRSKIYLWGIERTDKDKAVMKISIRGFHRIRKAAFKTKTHVRIKEKKGLPLYLHKHRKRKAFLIGVAIFAAITVFLTSFIWSVEIEGSEKIDKNRVRDALRSCGIDAGVVKYNHDLREIQNEMMKKVPELSWIWVEIKGTRAKVSIKERTEKPEIESGAPCNVVARCDGVVLSTIVRDGQRMVSVGDVIEKGQLLISGVIEGSDMQLRHAAGEIYAMTWHGKGGTFPLSKTVTEKTGNTYNRYSLSVGRISIPLYPWHRNPYKTFEISETENNLHLWGDMYLPLIFKTETIEETNVFEEEMSAEGAALYYSEILYNEIQSGLLEGTQVLEKNMEYSENGNGIDLKCTLTCSEEIGEVRKIETETEPSG